MNKTKIIYWATTLGIALPMFGNGIIELVQPQAFLESVTPLGYPLYFFKWLGVAKIIGALLISIPKIPLTFKNLGYAGFFFDFTFAFISLSYVGDFSKAFAPLLFMALLYMSYKYSNKLKNNKK